MLWQDSFLPPNLLLNKFEISLEMYQQMNGNANLFDYKVSFKVTEIFNSVFILSFCLFFTTGRLQSKNLE